MVDKNSSSVINFLKALKNLETSLSTPVTEARDLSGILKDFEMTYELSWKVLKKVLLEQGHQTLAAKDVFTKAYQLGLLETQSPWLEMIEDRNRSAHVYDEAGAKNIYQNISSAYLPALQKFREKFLV